MHTVVPYEVQSSEAQGVQTPPANWICPACFLTAVPFADASILSDEGEYYAETLNTSNLSNTIPFQKLLNQGMMMTERFL